MILKDWTGTRFGELVVLKEAPHKINKLTGRMIRRVVCKCDCGIEKEITLGNLTMNGKSTKSCGHRNTTLKQTHGLHKHPLYSTYNDMIRRCYNPKSKDYINYGGRGITVCNRWLGESGLQNFIKDMHPKLEGTTLDRKNTNKGYSKTNCRWVDGIAQGNNKRNNTIVVHEGNKMTFTELWRAKGKVCFNTAITRYTRLGWSALSSVSTPARRRTHDINL